ncbi:hypothetical protein LCGC14_1229290 [marine sediment metagenome]|uniref:Uncharacterized protein n=1 Tax=marine sediment metagenome TaxID=412755 RepID=A0A0F9NRB1_9ZZZZ
MADKRLKEQGIIPSMEDIDNKSITSQSNEK